MSDNKEQLFKRLPHRTGVDQAAAERFVQQGPVPVPPAGPLPAPAKPKEEKKSGFTYKHSERNNKMLKDLSGLLNRNMGVMLDEAIEEMIGRWKEEAAEKRNVTRSMIDQLVEM